MGTSRTTWKFLLVKIIELLLIFQPAMYGTAGSVGWECHELLMGSNKTKHQ